MNELIDLYTTFVRIGCVTFGGGYAMLPILERELVDKRHWTTMDDLRDYFSIGQCTPGIIALNVSTFIGEKKKGIPGALCATTGFLTGPIIIILIIASFLTNFADLPIVQHAFAGIRVCVCVLIVQAVLRLWKTSVVDPFSLFLYLLIFVCNAFSKYLPVKIPAAMLVIIAGVTGVVVSMRRRKTSAAAAGGVKTAGSEGAGADANSEGSSAEAGNREAADAEAGNAETWNAETGNAETGSAAAGNAAAANAETGNAETESTETGNAETGNAEAGCTADTGRKEADR